MSNWLYLAVNVLILVGPLGMLWIPHVVYRKQLKAVISSTLLVGGLFVLWDIWATANGVWAFNKDFVLGINIANLPLEEVMFFVTVPFSCLFIFVEVVEAFYGRFFEKFEKSSIVQKTLVWLCFGLGSLVLLGLNWGTKYSAVVAVVSFFTTATTLTLKTPKQINQFFWYITICILPFFLINTILTAVPVVTYNPAEILGIRVGTIPLEDFFYNYSLLGLYLLAFLKFRGK